MWAQLTWGLWGIGQAFHMLGRSKVWIPFAIFCAAQLVVLLGLANFYAWPLSVVVLPGLRAVLGEPAVHYPFNFIALPLLWTRLALILDLLFLGLVIGWTYLLVARSRGDREGTTGHLFRRWWAFAAVRIPFEAALVLLLVFLPGWVVGGEGGLSGNSLRLFRVATVALAIGLEALFLFIPLYVLRQSLGRAVQAGVSVFFRYPVATYLLAALPALLYLPFVWLLGRTESLVNNMAPEFVGWLLGLNIFFGALAGCLSVVGAGRLHETLEGRSEP